MQSIRLDTFRACLEQGHGLDCWCPDCRRWATTDLAEHVRQDLGDRLIRNCRPCAIN
jgi:hypothetical protein